MLRRSILILILAFFGFSVFAQNQSIARPKLIVGIVVDQMRWDFLYRYYDRYKAIGGFKRLLSQGFSCENTFIPYTPTVTACGHTCIYTGSVPAIHGITGNAWWDVLHNRSVYCTEDTSVRTVGNNNGLWGQQSPRNMLTTTICDELRLATNFKSKVIGVAIKDRGGILPAGHSANAAYWYNSGTGQWITSTYYMQELPDWVKKFNERKLVDKYYQQDWNTLYPINTYLQSASDGKAYESKPFGADQKGFPYNLKKFTNTNFGAIAATPYGNTLTIEMAKAALEAESLGTDAITDFLAVSFSSPDYVGHSFGPNSIEIEDTYLRLDIDLGGFLDYLDNKIGKGQYLVFLSADHGVAHVPGFSKENKLPGGLYFDDHLMDDLNAKLKQKFGQDSLVVSLYNYQVYLNYKKIINNKLDKEKMIEDVIEHLFPIEGVSQVFAINKLNKTPLPEKIRKMIANGYYPKRSGDIQIILKPGWIEAYSTTGTTHGLWNPYDSHIPLLWYGWNIKAGKTNREVHMTDIAPTIAAMLKIQMPSGSVGDVIEELVK